MFAQVLSQSCVLKHCDFDTVISLSYVDSHTKNIVFDYVESTIKSIKENDYKYAFFLKFRTDETRDLNLEHPIEDKIVQCSGRRFRPGLRRTTRRDEFHCETPDYLHLNIIYVA